MQQIIDHLESNAQNAIVISFQNMKMINPFMRVNKYEFTKNHIEKGWGTIAAFLKGLKKEGFGSGTQVCLKKPNGTTSKTIGEPITLQFSNDIQTIPQMAQTGQQQTVQQTVQQNTLAQNGYHGMQYPAMGSGMMGVHPTESKLEAITSKYDDLKERYQELKNDYQDIRSSERQLKEENNSLKLEVNTAEKHKELAILQANLNQKSFMDSDAMKSLAENLAPVLPQMISGQQAQIGMGNAHQNVSSNKKQFIDFIASTNVQDADVDFIYTLYKHTLKNKDFAASLQGLLTQFNII
ncbi:hypothetical protein H2O64_04760 [Kordia sp. YSTF-M3]|uniref:Uncharacterized protein n=1 Tax=Kordia aestuariivivens TaxID=2759037 RepID=A0ABR7Q5X3_9FLAO|nr:hypothetical protein [Kordia aestuariivivens]MBC8753970.1 hypothetical protein [Kordia aestuariivivens]